MRKISTFTILSLLSLFFLSACKTPPKANPGDTIAGFSDPTARPGYVPEGLRPTRPQNGMGMGDDSINPSDMGADNGMGAFNGMGGDGGSAFGLEGRDLGGVGAAGLAGGSGRGQFESVYFGFNQSFIESGERSKLFEVAKYLNRNPQNRVVLEGHCDWKGTTEYNLALGDRRARSVKQFLEGLDVPSSRMEVLSKGDQDAVDGGSAAQMQKDRRVEFILVPGASY